jgi:hypothetical protein
MAKFYVPADGVESWRKQLAEPEKHWKKGYSARTLAYCWEEAQGFPASVKKVFKKSSFPVFKSIEFLIGIPEHKVPLPGGRTESQNDIFVLAKSGNELISITVEGKVNEELGPRVRKKRADTSLGVVERLEYLSKLLNIADKGINHIRYQLLHRTASALIEAERFCAPHALMLVHSFSQRHKWFDDFAAFTVLYGIEAELNTVHHVGQVSGKELYLAWVVGEKEDLER